ncbi:MAG: BatA domain-containing protein [Kiritimatiellae bacterium]|nr:BatA domain-containing protein [Kiritimatiellia bacterium]
MFPFLTYPLALAGLISLPVLAGIYFLRNRFRRWPVSSLMLWSFATRAKEGGRRLARIQVPLIFLLELLVLVLLTIGAVDPRWPTSRSRRPLVVVLDDSVSMLAELPGGRPRDRAEEAVLDVVARTRPSSLRFVLAGRRIETLGHTGVEAGPVRATLKRWACSAPTAALHRAVGLAFELAGSAGLVLVLSDQPPAAETLSKGRIRWLAFGRPEPNVGIVNATRSRAADTERCLLEVAAFAPEPVRTVLHVETGGTNGPASRLLTLEPGAAQRVVFDLPPGAGTVRARLNADRLAVDDAIELVAEPPRNVRVQTQIGDPRLRELVDDALAASDMRSRVTLSPQLIITDRSAVTTSDPWTWVVHLLSGDACNAYVGPFVADWGHPLMKGVSLDGVVWGVPATNTLDGVPVVMAGSIPLLSDDEGLAQSHRVRLRISPAHSTLQKTPNWPVLFWNLMHWRAAEAPGMAEVNLRLGMDAVITARPGVHRLLTTEPGRARTERRVDGDRVVIPVRQTGVYKVEVDEQPYLFASNLLAPEESDLSGCRSGEWGGWVDQAAIKRDYASTAWVFALLTLAALTGHMALVARMAGRKTLVG